MNSEELKRKYFAIKKEIENTPPCVLVDFSVFKKNVPDFPPDATMSAKKVTLYLNIITNEISFYQDNKETIQLNRYWYPNYYYAQYLPKYNCVAISVWEAKAQDYELNIKDKKYEGKGPFKLDCQPAKLSDLVLIAEDKKFIGYVTDYDFISDPKLSALDARTYNEIGSYHYEAIFHGHCPSVLNACKQLFKIGLLGGNKFTLFANCKELMTFLAYKEPQMRDTPKQKLVNELLKVKLLEPTLTFDVESPKKLICVASKVNEEYSALRWFMNTDSLGPYEISRLYVNKKTHIFCRKNSKGEYLLLNNKLMPAEFDSQQVVIQDADAFDGTKLEYFTSIYKALEPSQRASMLYMLTVYPEFERMYKGGMKPVCDNYLGQMYQHSWVEYLRAIFGTIDMKQKTLPKMFGFNKYQLELIQSHFYKAATYNTFGAGKDIKEILSVDDCNDIDPVTFKSIFDILVKEGDSDTDNRTEYYYTISRRRRIKDALELTIKTYSLKVCMNMLPKIKEIAFEEKIIFVDEYVFGSSYNANTPTLTLYNDYVKTVMKLDAARTMRPQFDTFGDIKRMHDDVVATYNLKKTVAKVTQFKSHISKWKQWEYKDDDKFVVIAPTTPEDIAVEGLELHHCVKSYIDRVASGDTNIMFIRLKEEPTKPFFTVEVSNLKTIEQVHGFANRNANTEPGLENFVKQWAKTKKLKCYRINKIR